MDQTLCILMYNCFSFYVGFFCVLFAESFWPVNMYSILCRVEPWLMKEPHTICVSFLLITMMKISSHQYLMIKVPFNTFFLRFKHRILIVCPWLSSVVDNLKPTEIVVSFSALSRWHDPPPQGIEETKSHTNLKGKKGDPEKELTTVTSSSVMEGKSYCPWPNLGERDLHLPIQYYWTISPLNFSKCTKYLVRECILARLLHAIPYL